MEPGAARLAKSRWATPRREGCPGTHHWWTSVPLLTGPGRARVPGFTGRLSGISEYRGTALFAGPLS